MRERRNKTTLSKYIWELKDKTIAYEINWKILKCVPSYSKEAKRCQLCLAEKVLILYADKKTLLNERSEIMGKCRHGNKHKLDYLMKKPKKRAQPGDQG